MYGKIFKQIFNSSIARSHKIRHLFMDLVVLADADGTLDMTHESISGQTGIPLEDVREGIGTLENPDADSRTPDEDGRRLVRLDHRKWGWRIVNYPKYRGIKCEFDRKSYMRNYMKVKRKGKKKPLNKQSNKSFTSPSSSSSASSSLAEGLNFPVQFSASPKFMAAWGEWVEYRKEVKKFGNWQRLFNAQLKWLEQFTPDSASEVLLQSIRNGWQGLFELKGNHATNGKAGNQRNVGIKQTASQAGADAAAVVARQAEKRKEQNAQKQVATEVDRP